MPKSIPLKITILEKSKKNLEQFLWIKINTNEGEQILNQANLVIFQN